MEYKRLIMKKSEDTSEIDIDRMVEISDDRGKIKLNLWAVEVRIAEEFRHHAIYLPPYYDWILGKDSVGAFCLVPLKKESD